jgi:hypothetical protein
MLVRGVINTALRKLGRLGGGREPRLADQQDTLEALQGLYRSWIASGAFGRLCDVVPTGDYTARPNERIFRRSDAVETIKLPELISNGSWTWNCTQCTLLYDPYCDPILDLGLCPAVSCDPILGLGYQSGLSDATTPRDGSVVVISDECSGTTTDFLYDGSTKQWQAVHSLTLDSEAPRSFADPQGLAACLALEVADIFGADVPPTALAQAMRYRTALISRYSMPRIATVGVYV